MSVIVLSSALPAWRCPTCPTADGPPGESSPLPIDARQVTRRVGGVRRGVDLDRRRKSFAPLLGERSRAWQRHCEEQKNDAGAAADSPGSRSDCRTPAARPLQTASDPVLSRLTSRCPASYSSFREDTIDSRAHRGVEPGTETSFRRREMARLRVGVLISGRGSNLRALIEACADPAYPAEIVSVISNRAEAPGLAIAAAARIAGVFIRHRDRPDFAAEADVAAPRAAGRPGLPCRVHARAGHGFCRGLARQDGQYSSFAAAGISRSSPAASGARGQGCDLVGCTVHFVRPEVDAGPIIAQAVVPTCPGDDEGRLASRILAVEHRLYPLAVRLIAEGRVRVVGDIVEIDRWQAPTMTVLNPWEPAGEPLAAKLDWSTLDQL